MHTLDERLELYFYKKEERFATWYLLFLLVLFFLLYQISSIPYQKKEQVIGIIKKIDKKYVIVVRMQATNFYLVHKNKVTFENNQYSYHVQHISFLNEKELEVLMTFPLSRTYHKENKAILLQFNCGKTTLLKEIIKKMKGWFL